MKVYQVRLLNLALNLDQTIDCPEDEYILDVAQSQGINLPAGCLQGECSVCLAKIIQGEIDQSEQRFLNAQEVAAGYTVICVAYPRSNCLLETHQEQVLYNNSLYYSPS